MSEKEERILVARSTDYTLTDTDKGKLFEGNIESHCANVFTRQEAINCIGYALFEAGLKEGADYYAEAALNSLLGETK